MFRHKEPLNYLEQHIPLSAMLSDYTVRCLVSRLFRTMEIGRSWRRLVLVATRPGSGWRGNFLGKLQRRLHGTNACRHTPTLGTSEHLEAYPCFR